MKNGIPTIGKRAFSRFQSLEFPMIGKNAGGEGKEDWRPGQDVNRLTVDFFEDFVQAVQMVMVAGDLDFPEIGFRVAL